MPFVPCRITPPMNFRSSVNSSASTFSSIPSRFALSHSIDSSVKYSSASSRNIHLALIGKLSNAQLNCIDCKPGHLLNTVAAPISTAISCVPSLGCDSTTKICRGFNDFSRSRQRRTCSFSCPTRIRTDMSVISHNALQK